MPDAWVLGALINNVFSLAGDADTPYVNQMLLKPFASQPLNASAQGFYNAERPDGVGETTLRLQLQLLFPTG